MLIAIRARAVCGCRLAGHLGRTSARPDRTGLALRLTIGFVQNRRRSPREGGLDCDPATGAGWAGWWGAPARDPAALRGARLHRQTI
jgi:hypothetical protein